MDRYFDGSFKKLVSFFAKKEEIDIEELDDIMKMMEKEDEAREALKAVMKKHFHHKITPEIRRELFGAQAYREERKQADEMQL